MVSRGRLSPQMRVVYKRISKSAEDRRTEMPPDGWTCALRKADTTFHRHAARAVRQDLHDADRRFQRQRRFNSNVEVKSCRQGRRSSALSQPATAVSSRVPCQRIAAIKTPLPVSAPEAKAAIVTMAITILYVPESGWYGSVV